MKLSEWLELERGRAQALAEFLHVSPGRVSQIAAEGCVPQRHMRGTHEFTKGEVSFEDMVPEAEGTKS